MGANLEVGRVCPEVERWGITSSRYEHKEEFRETRPDAGFGFAGEQQHGQNGSNDGSNNDDSGNGNGTENTRSACLPLSLHDDTHDFLGLTDGEDLGGE
jgi:hypothetical protein